VSPQSACRIRSRYGQRANTFQAKARDIRAGPEGKYEMRGEINGDLRMDEGRRDRPAAGVRIANQWP